MSGQPGRPPAPKRQINIWVDAKVYACLNDMARKASMPTGTLARLLFEAAYAARCGETGDHELDALVARVAFLWSAAVDVAASARMLGISEALVCRIRDAWRVEVAGEVLG